MRRHTRDTLLYILCGVSLLAAVMLIIFIVYTLVLRTNYKKMALEINETILEISADSVTVSRDGDVYPVTDEFLEYYNMFFTERKTVPFNRDEAPVSDRTLCFDFGKSQLYLSPYDDLTATNIRWVTEEGEHFFSVRGEITFTLLSSYYTAYTKRSVKP